MNCIIQHNLCSFTSINTCSMPIYLLQRVFYPQNRPCTPKIVGTFYMQGYKVKEKTAILPYCTPSFNTQWAPWHVQNVLRKSAWESIWWQLWSVFPEPLLRGHLSWEVTIDITHEWPPKTGLTVYYIYIRLKIKPNSVRIRF